MYLIAALVALTLAGGHEFDVSVTGSDANAGTRARPFRTLERARVAVKTYRQANPNINRPVVVTVERGVYELDHAFTLTPEDSGTVQSPTIYRGDHATLSGGQIIRGFTVNSKGWWTTVLPEVRDGHWRFSQLWVNGQRRYRPRWPKDGYSTITAEVPPSAAAKGHGYDRFQFKPGDIDKNWHNLGDVELLCFHIWDMSRMRIGSIDDATHVVTTSAPTGYDAGWANFPKGNRFIAENVREALAQPGEWYVDTTSGELTYIPMPGETPTNSTVVAPNIDRIVDIQGSVPAHRYVQNVRFEGLDFAYTNWYLPPQGRFAPQAESDLGAAIHAEGWREGSIERCSIEATGEYAVELAGGCRNVRVADCSLTDLGAGGVKIGEMRQYDDEADCANGITVHNCLIAHGGRLHPAGIGVWIGQSAHDEVSNNEIYDLYYTGISIGWTWGYSKSETHDDLIAYNDIHDIGQHVLSDMGGIYTLGIEPGTHLIGNRIHDVYSFSYGGWGIYMDEGSSHELIENNVVYKAWSGGFHQHYGQENLLRNNIFVGVRSTEGEIVRTKAEDHLSFTFEHNIVAPAGGHFLAGNWSGNNYHLDDNVYWQLGSPSDFAGMTLEQWRAKGQDLHSMIADPLFRNWLGDDYRLQPISPAFALGFQAFDQSRAGMTGRPLGPDAPQKPAFPTMQVNIGFPLRPLPPPHRDGR